MTRVEIILYWARRNEPDTVLAEATFTNDAVHDASLTPIPYRLVLRRLPADEVDDGRAYVIEDTSDADAAYDHTASGALDYFLRLAADEVRRLNEPRTDDEQDSHDHARWAELAEAVRWKVYGDDDNTARGDADRAAILAWLNLGEFAADDEVTQYALAWGMQAAQTGYDRTRNLRLVQNGDAR